MRVPIYLQIAQWALLFGLGFLVVVMYRQLGRLLGHSGETPELGPRTGSMAAPFRYERIPDGGIGQLRPGNGQPVLLAFVDPTCPACEQLVTSLGDLQAEDQLQGARPLLLISDPPGYLRISAAFQATSLEIGRPLTAAEVAGYRATGTPLLVAVDASGVVRAAGTASRPDEVLAFTAVLAGPDHAGTAQARQDRSVQAAGQRE
jgi:hypothetical protein